MAKTACISSILVFCYILAMSGVARAQLTVSRVVDGDTFELSNGVTVRLIGIDTPEKYTSDHLRRDARRSQHDVETIRKLGRRASKYATQLIKGEYIELTYDQANAASDHRGGFGRLLAYVWVLNDRGEKDFMVNRRMVKEGYAHAYTKYPFKYMEEFRRLERRARKQDRGLWNMMDSESNQAGQSTDLKYDPFGPDRDCSDFTSHKEAQRFFEARPGDPHNLDGDGDGLACERLPQ